MSDFDDEDPEVVADRKLRAVTERQRAKLDELPVWEPPKVLRQVPCRGQCGNLTEWNQYAQDQFEIFNAELARQDQSPIDRTRTLFCPSCRALGAKMAADRNRKAVNAMADLIRRLKASADPDSETAILEKIRLIGHPDIPGLLQALRDRKGPTNRSSRDVLR